MYVGGGGGVGAYFETRHGLVFFLPSWVCVQPGAVWGAVWEGKQGFRVSFHWVHEDFFVFGWLDVHRPLTFVDNL